MISQKLTPKNWGVLGVCFAFGFWVLAKETNSSKPEKEPIPKASWKAIDEDLFEVIAGFRGILISHENDSIFVDPCLGPKQLQELGCPKRVTQVFLTRHDRHVSDFALEWQRAGIPVFAGPKTVEILLPSTIEKYWNEIVPLRNSRVFHFMPETGFTSKACPESQIFGPWTIRNVSLPGPASDQSGFVLTHRKTPQNSKLICGQLTTGNGKIFAAYTTDWDHWTELGLKTHSQSIEKAIQLGPTSILPALGPIVDQNPITKLEDLKKRVDEAAFLKSFERFSKQRLGNQPNYPFLAREQAESNGSKPWSRLSTHLWNTGNTFVLVSESGDFLVVDPWDPHSAKQIPLLKLNQKLGKLEGIFCSHAHFDHFDGIYSILEKLGNGEKPKLWTTSVVAAPLEDPYRLWAPFLDARKIQFDQKFEQGQTHSWREFQFRFHDFPGQTRFTQALEVTIDGHHCLFTADNFFHQDQFSGSGGWMGMNRSSPLGYAQSARKVLVIRPEWALAEHGGPFVFNSEDFRRRELWGLAAAKAADALCLSGNHLIDWDPHRIRCEPVLLLGEDSTRAKPQLVLGNQNHQGGKQSIQFGPSTVTRQKDQPAGQTGVLELSPGQSQTLPLPWPTGPGIPSTGVRTMALWENGEISQVDCFQIKR